MNPFTFSRRRKRRFGSHYMGEMWRRVSENAASEREIKRAIEVKEKISDKETSGQSTPQGSGH